MRKVLISLIVCFALILTAFFVVKGSDRLKIHGIMDLSEKNEEVDKTISNLSKVISSDYTTQYSQLKSSADSLVEHKTEYENQYVLSQTGEQSYANGREKYDIDFLWTVIGNYAKDEGVTIQIDVTKTGVSEDLYNLNFSVNGSYIGITNFIYDIENNSKLGFKIDNFVMTASTDNIYSQFVCKGIPIKLGNLDTTTQNPNTTDNTNTTNNTKTMDNTNTTNDTTNSTNETNNTNNTNATNTDEVNSTNTTNAANTSSNESDN